MSDPEKLTREFWSALKSDRTLMLGLAARESGFSRPMTAQFENDRSPLWFFTSSETELARELAHGKAEQAFGAFCSKGHDLFAALQGDLRIDNNPTLPYTLTH